MSRFCQLRTALTLVLLAVAGLLSVATSPARPRTHRPRYMSWEKFRQAVRVLPPRPIKKRGKIWVHQNLLFISEPDQGIHVIDNTDPRKPVPRAFVRIPGNQDLAVHGNHLYADSAVDLLTFQFATRPLQIALVGRQKNVFPYDYRRSIPRGRRIWPGYVDRKKGVVVGFDPIRKKP